MKCRLTNGFKNFLFNLVTIPFWIALGGLAGFSILYGLAYVIGTTMITFEVHTWTSWVVHGMELSNMFDYTVSIGMSFLGYSVVVFIVGLLLMILLGGLIIGTTEYYDEFKWKRRSLEAKYERPFRWYHVLLSYIITCEVTKKDAKGKQNAQS